MKNNKIAGRHLWKVSARYTSWGLCHTVNLLIVTEYRSAETAAQKAKRFLWKQRSEFPGGSVVKVEWEGVIDA